jgi:hypothetical protein
MCLLSANAKEKEREVILRQSQKKKKIEKKFGSAET